MSLNNSSSLFDSEEQNHKDRSERNEVLPQNETPVEQKKLNNQDKTNHYILFGLLIFATLAFLPLIVLFFIPLILATTFSSLFFPFFTALTKLTRGNKTLSSFLCCLILLLGILIPLYIIIHLMVDQMVQLYATAEPQIQDLIQKGKESRIIQQIFNSHLFKYLQISNFNLSGLFQDIAKRAAEFGTIVINRTSSGVFGLVVNLAVTLYTMFYLFKDGESLVKRIRRLSPLKNEYEDLIIDRFLLISRATIKGTIIIGIIQGSLGAITLLIFGIKSWLLWGFIMVVFAIIPMLGTWLILIPAGIIQILFGNLWQGIGILLSTLIVVSNIDNIIRPRLVGSSAKMHDLLVFFSTLGGLSVFGVMGFIVGPVIASLFITVIDIYDSEFGPKLEKLKT